MIDDSDRFLEDADRRDIARIVKAELAKAADPEAALKAQFDYSDTDDGTPVERRARLRAAERMAGQELDEDAPLYENEIAAELTWEQRHDEDARSRLLPDTEPKTPTRRGDDKRNEVCPYDYGDPI